MSVKVAPAPETKDAPSLSMLAARESNDYRGDFNEIAKPAKMVWHVDGYDLEHKKTAAKLSKDFMSDEEHVAAIMNYACVSCQSVQMDAGYFAGIHVEGCKACAGYRTRLTPHTCLRGAKKSIVKPGDLTEEMRICNGGQHFHWEGEIYVFTRSFQSGILKLFTICGISWCPCFCCKPHGHMNSTSEYASLDSDKVIHFSDTLNVEGGGSGLFLITKGLTTTIDGVEVGRLRLVPDKIYTVCARCLRLFCFCILGPFILCKMWCCCPPQAMEISFAGNGKQEALDGGAVPTDDGATIRWKKVQKGWGDCCCMMVKYISGQYIPCYLMPCLICCALCASLPGKVGRVIGKICAPIRKICKMCPCCRKGMFSASISEGPVCRHKRNGFFATKIPAGDGYTAVAYAMQQLSYDPETDEEVRPNTGRSDLPMQLMGCGREGLKPTDYLTAAASLNHPHVNEVNGANMKMNGYGLCQTARTYMIPDRYDMVYGYGWYKAFTIEQEHNMADLTHVSQCQTCIDMLEQGRHLTCPWAEKQRTFDRQIALLKKKVDKNHTVKEAIRPPEPTSGLAAGGFGGLFGKKTAAPPAPGGE